VTTWPRARRPIDPAPAAVLAELDQLVMEFKALGCPYEVEQARRVAESVLEFGVDTVSDIRVRRLRRLLEAAQAG
jgi:hypothetical protein